MSVTDELLREREAPDLGLDRSSPMPVASSTIAVVACVGGGYWTGEPGGPAISISRLGADELILIDHADCARLVPAPEDGPASAESDVRRFVGRMSASGASATAHAIRGYIYEVETDRLIEVS